MTSFRRPAGIAAHDVEMTSRRRRFDVITSHRRHVPAGTGQTEREREREKHFHIRNNLGLVAKYVPPNKGSKDFSKIHEFHTTRGRNTVSLVFMIRMKFRCPDGLWVLNQRRIWQRKERDGLRLSYALPKKQWVSDPGCPYADDEKLYLYPAGTHR